MTGVDIIGVIFNDPAEPMGEAVAIEGWHVNTTPDYLAAHPDLAPFVVTPAVLRRVWAGDDPANPSQTVALRFADEAEALSRFPAA
jgi:hypothetical protein